MKPSIGNLILWNIEPTQYGVGLQDGSTIRPAVFDIGFIRAIAIDGEMKFCIIMTPAGTTKILEYEKQIQECRAYIISDDNTFSSENLSSYINEAINNRIQYIKIYGV